jgi:hypothetical protein
MKIHLPRRTIGALAALLLTACPDSGSRPIEQNIPAEPEPVASVTVRVANHNWSTVVVYLILDGNRQRLGQVETGIDATFTLPRRAALRSDLALVAELIGSDAEFDTGPILVGPGARVVLTIENHMPLSYFHVSNP